MSTKKIVKIDGIPVEIKEEKNLLELIRKAGIQLPTFCYHSGLSIYGACRMCMVEDERGNLDAACSAQPWDGMVVKTNTQRLRKYRKMILELLLSNHCRDCTVCDDSGECKLQALAANFHMEKVRFANTAETPDIDKSSVSVVKDQSKCILCGDCVRACDEIQNIGAIDFAFRGSKMRISTAFEEPLAESNCVGCGQCVAVCPTGAFVVRNHTEKVWKDLDNAKIKMTAQIAPAVRTAIGERLGLPSGVDSMGKLVAALRRLGFEEVYDTATGADITVLEESEELLGRIEKNENLPLLTSCCPAWVVYCEKNHPDMLKNISTCRSPMQIMGSILKEYHKDDERQAKHVAIMPCTAKKAEAARDEFMTDGTPNVDYVLTTQELSQMIREAGIVFEELEPETVDMPFGVRTGAGVIFGVTGGVTEAVLRRLSTDKTLAGLRMLALDGVRGMEGFKETTIMVGEREVRIGVVSGLKNANDLLERVKDGEHFDFIEVMACPGGCVNGGGQSLLFDETVEPRSKGLYDSDRACRVKRSEENPLLPPLYDDLLKGKVHELLHVHYGEK